HGLDRGVGEVRVADRAQHGARGDRFGVRPQRGHHVLFELSSGPAHRVILAPLPPAISSTSCSATFRSMPSPPGPPHRTSLPGGVDGWLVTRYADARTVLADPRFVRDPVRVARLRGHPAPPCGGRAATLLHLDPPEHTRVRRAVSPAFTTRRVEQHGSTVDELAAALVDRCQGSGRADLVCDLAVPLAVGVLCAVAGLPVADHARFGPWVRRIHGMDGGAEAGLRAMEAVTALDRYLGDRIADGAAGVLGELAGAARLTRDEVIALGRDLLVGGYESTANLISGGLALLLAEPVRLERLRRDPGLLDAVVEECLRQVAPFPLLEAR